MTIDSELRNLRITASLPEQLRDDTNELVKSGLVGSTNELMAGAAERELKRRGITVTNDEILE